MTTELSAPDNRVAPAAVADALRPLLGNSDGRVVVAGAAEPASWRAEMAGLLEPGDRILAAGGGRDARRWAEDARAAGFEVIRGSAGWGEPPSPDEISYLLWWDPSVKAVFVHHCDPTTGALADLGRIRRAMDETGSEALLLVDVSGTLGIVELRQDEWQVDLAVAGPDRCLMSPPGATVVSLSSRATGAASRRASYPPVSEPQLRGLRTAIDAVLGEGLDNVLHRHQRAAAAIRAAVAAWGLRALGPDVGGSPAATPFVLPPGINGGELSAACQREFGVHLTPCRDPQGDSAVVWQHGDGTGTRCLADVAAVELVLVRLGHPLPLGTGLAAAAPRLLDGSLRGAA